LGEVDQLPSELVLKDY
jgi:hypothetical protein